MESSTGTNTLIAPGTENEVLTLSPIDYEEAMDDDGNQLNLFQ